MRIIIAAAISCATTAANAMCPLGTFPSFDGYGNQTCNRFNGAPAITQSAPGIGSCPMGSYPSYDGYGNRICQNGGGTRYYDTSRGCPAGTFHSYDGYGNPVCKRF